MTSRFILPFANVGSGIKPSSGAKLFFYATGTNTPKDTFSDTSGTENTNPVVADSNGVFSNIFIDGVYKVILQNKNSSQIWEADPVTSSVSTTEIGVFYFDNIAEMKLQSFAAGFRAHCDRYYENGALVDNLNYFGVSGTGDGFINHTMASGSVSANLIKSDCILIQQAGILGLTEQSTAMQAVVDFGIKWVVPKGFTVIARNINLPTNNKGFIDGEWKMPDNASAGDWLFIATNKSKVDVIGKGNLNGNSANQGWAAPDATTNAPQGLALFDTCTDSNLLMKSAGLNFAPNNAYFTDSSDSAIRFRNGTRNKCIIQNLVEWGREGVFFEEETLGTIEVTNADGVNAISLQANIDKPSYPYSAGRHTGVNSKYNVLRNSQAIRCGAASFALDSQRSKMYSIISRDNAFFAAITFGHPGTPATDSIGYDLYAENSGAVEEGANGHGIQIQGASANVTLSDINAKSCNGAGVNVVGSSINCNISNVESNGNLGATGHGINVSDSSTNIKLGGVISTNNNAQNGINSFGANVDFSTATLRSVGNTGRSVAIRSSGAGVAIVKEVIEAVQHEWVFDNLTNPIDTQLLDMQHIDGAGDSATILEISYYQRNPGSTTPSNQFFIEKKYMLFGFGTTRQILEISSSVQGRYIAASYTSGTRTFKFVLTDGSSAVAAGNNPNGLIIRINQHAKIFNTANVYLQ